MKIIIPGKPIAKKRARHASRGSFVVTYDPQEKDKKHVRKLMYDLLLAEMNSDNRVKAFEAGKICRSSVFYVEFVFFLPTNQSDSVSVKNKKLWGIQYASCKPDYDNLEKFYLDCANGVLWNDDSSIIRAKAVKLYDEKPRVEIVVTASDEIKLMPEIEKIMASISPSEMVDMITYAKKIAEISPLNLSCIENDTLAEWLTETACILSDFSLKFAPIMSKISKNGNVRDEVKKIKSFKSEIENGVYNI